MQTATRSVRVTHDARKHGELLMPGALAACAEAGVALPDVDAVVVGIGPGPFTGLRVGMVTAAALGDALGVPVHGVCSLDAIAAEVVGEAADRVAAARRHRRPAPRGLLGRLRRRRPDLRPARRGPRGPRRPDPRAGCRRGRRRRAPAVTGLRVVPPDAPGPAGLVACALDALRAGVRPGPLEPLYLRRPDAVAPGPRKPVTAG